MIFIPSEGRGSLLGRRGIEQFHLAAQLGLESISFILMNASFFDCFVYDGEGQRKESLSFFLILVLDSLLQLFYFSPEEGLVSSVDGLPPQAVPPLAFG